MTELRAARLLTELEASPSAARELQLLDALATEPLDAPTLLRYHDALLFTAAYPRSEQAWALCQRELAGFFERVRALAPQDRHALLDSGVVGAPQCYPYDLGNARWFASRPGGRVEFAWDLIQPRARRHLAAIVRGLLDPLSASALDEASDHALGVRRALDRVRGRATAFDWVSARLRRALPDGLDEIVFNRSDFPLRVETSVHGPNRTLNRESTPRRPILFDPDVAKLPVAVVEEIKRPLDFGRPVSPRRGAALLAVIRGMVLSRGRELHAMTHGNPDEVYQTSLERGARLVVWMMLPAERLPLEVGWYFMMTRNGVPLAYGGGGMFATRAEVGMNLFDPYRRSGEARWIFTQIARAAYSFCPVPWIATRSYQFGGDDNDEGIASGAYWFYDKLGFRSVDPALRALADRERTLRAATPSYRTARRVLRRLARADIVLPLDGQSPADYREYPGDQVGLRLAKAIAARFGPDREGLAAWANSLVGRSAFRTESRAHRQRRLDTALFALITDSPLRSEARRAARLKGGRWEGAYAKAMPSLLPWFTDLARETGP